jgi:DNA-binding NarL/FixJ family response regulator
VSCETLPEFERRDIEPAVRKLVSRLRVLLADDSAAVESGIRRLLEPEFDVVGSVGDGRSLLNAAKKLRPDIIIVDILMPGMSGLEAVRQLRKRRLGGIAIFLTVLGDKTLIEEAQKAGAKGYVLKSSADRDLVDAIHAVSAGRLYVSPALRR